MFLQISAKVMTATQRLGKIFHEQKCFCLNGAIPFTEKCRKDLDPSNNFSKSAIILLTKI